VIHFELKTGPEKGRRFSLNDERVIIGRGPHCQIKVTSQTVSLKHCEVRREDGPIYVIQDLGSSNGTRLEKRDAKPLQGPYRLKSGDTIWIGDIQLDVTIDERDTRRKHRSDFQVLDRPTDDDLFALQAAKRARIRFIAGPHRNRLVLLGERPIVLGRGEESDVVLVDALLELRHAIVTKSEGKYFIVPIESAGSLALNSRPIKTKIRIQHGDVIAIGMSVFEFLASDVGEHDDPFETAALRAPRFVLFGEVRLMGTLTVGRDPSSDLFLDDPDIERHHAELAFAGRSFTVKSIGGAPIYVDGRAVLESELATGNLIGIGNYALRIDLDGYNCVIDVTRSAPDERMQRLAPAIEDASPYQTIYRLQAPTKPKEEKRMAPKWREPWDVRKTRLLASVVGASLLGVAGLALFTVTGGGERLLGQPLSAPHANLDNKDRCAPCHGAFAGADRDRCSACHEKNKPRPRHEFGECNKCHVEHRSEDRLALVSSARCADCHADRHKAFETTASTPGSLAIAEVGRPVPTIRADLHFEPEARSYALHRKHGSVPKGCAACHESAQGGDLKEPRQACFGCHPGLQALSSSACAGCHREHGDQWAPEPSQDDLHFASTKAFAQAGVGVFGLLSLATLGMFAHSVAARRKEKKEEAQRKAKSTASAGEKYDVLINYNKCVPIGACVKACPFDVLAMVPHPDRGGKVLPKAVNLEQCKACRACEESCGVKAIQVVTAGESAAALSLPEIDANYESNVPGLYVIGEAAGKPLVKNANNLGFHVVNHMLTDGLAPGHAQSAGLDYDVIVLGAGPAGLSAAVSAKKVGLRALLLERHEAFANTHRKDYPKGKEVIAEPIDVQSLGHLPIFTATKEEVLAAWGAVIEKEQLDIRYHTRIESIERDDSGFTVLTDSARYDALRVVIATGARGSPRRLAVPGAELPHVRYALEDANEFANVACVVVGGGDNALETAIFLSDAQRGKKGSVALVYRGNSFKRARAEARAEVEARAKAGRLTVHLDTNPIEIRANTIALEKKGGAKLDVRADAVFTMLGAEPALDFLSRIGVKIVQKPADWDPGPTDVLVKRLLEEMGKR
jgi:thioredoxin reductase (NADPH)